MDDPTPSNVLPLQGDNRIKSSGAGHGRPRRSTKLPGFYSMLENQSYDESDKQSDGSKPPGKYGSVLAKRSTTRQRSKNGKVKNAESTNTTPNEKLAASSRGADRYSGFGGHTGCVEVDTASRMSAKPKKRTSDLGGVSVAGTPKKRRGRPRKRILPPPAQGAEADELTIEHPVVDKISNKMEPLATTERPDGHVDENGARRCLPQIILQSKGQLCDVCRVKIFEDDDEYHQHVQTAHPDPILRFQCSLCPDKFRSKSYYNHHMKSKHGGIESGESDLAK